MVMFFTLVDSVSKPIRTLVICIDGEVDREILRLILGIKHRTYFEYILTGFNLCCCQLNKVMAVDFFAVSLILIRTFYFQQYPLCLQTACETR